MKKIFTLLALSAMAFGMQAAAPELLFNGQPVEAGVTYRTGYTAETTTEEIPGWGSFTVTTYKQDSELSVRADKDKSVTVEVKASSKVQFCGVENKCNMITDDTRSNTAASAPSAVVEGNNATFPLLIDIATDDYDGVDPATLLSDITVEVTAYYTSSPAEKATATVELTKLPASEINYVANISTDVDITYTRGSLNYNIAAPTKLSIYNTNGQLVVCRLVKGVGSVALDSLHPGVYVYSIAGKSGKIVVRK